MKCAHCGATIEEGRLYCSVCGKAVNLVPDYNEFDDEYLNGLIINGQQNILNHQEKADSAQSSETTSIYPRNNRKKMMIIIGLLVAMALAIAAAIYTSVTSKHMNSFSYQMEMGEISAKESNYNDAIDYFERAISLDDKKIEPYINLADIYEKKQDYVTAEDMLYTALSLDKNNYKVYSKLIKLFEKTGATEKISTLSKGVTDEKIKKLFTKFIPNVPSFSTDRTTFEGEIKLKIITDDPKNTMYYTLNGKDPIEFGTRFDKDDEICINHPGEYLIKAVVKNAKGVYSDVIEKRCRIIVSTPDVPVVSPGSGSYSEPTYVTISVPAGCQAYYTWDGETPTKESEPYAEPVLIPEGNHVLSVICIDPSNGKSSDVYSAYYEYYAQ